MALIFRVCRGCREGPGGCLGFAQAGRPKTRISVGVGCRGGDGQGGGGEAAGGQRAVERSMQLTYDSLCRGGLALAVKLLHSAHGCTLAILYGGGGRCLRPCESDNRCRQMKNCCKRWRILDQVRLTFGHLHRRPSSCPDSKKRRPV